MAAETFGPYRIEELLGRGGMGEVHRAYDTVHDRVVALKRLSAQFNADADYRARFRAESKIVARLREPHVIPIHAYGEIDGHLYLDMRLVEGRDLTDLITGPVDARRAVRIVEQVASALDAAHADGLVHRDVKPSNILVAAGDFVYLVDFGIARSSSPTATHLTASGDVVGTLDYMAPERFSGGPVDGRVDVYALACVLFTSVTGRRPFTADTTAAQIWAHMQEPPPRASQTHPAVPPALDDVITRGMAKDPAQRYPTAGALAAAAAAALDQAPAAPPVSTPPRGQPVAPRFQPPVPTPPHGQQQFPTPPRGQQFPTPPHGQLRPPTPPPWSPAPPGPSTRPGPSSRDRAVLVGAVGAVLVIAAVVVSLVVLKDKEGGQASGRSSDAPTSSTTTSATPTTSAVPTTTSPPPPPNPSVAALQAVLPTSYVGNPTCVEEENGGGGELATVECTEANGVDGYVPPPERAVFRLFADRAAQDAYFLKLVQDNNLPRIDEQGGCRPVTQPLHYAEIWRTEAGPLPGEFTTCFVKDGTGQLWWVDSKTLTIGQLVSSKATTNEALDKLDLWWNHMILSKMN
ncbi:serine/threonine-protein kinase [Umezawaea sp.]|uniref:serine/threonine-protein kinase n=1 Tax=Umezawaea sp. TaxID=1955258 RepID=UPI002ED5F265